MNIDNRFLQTAGHRPGVDVLGNGKSVSFEKGEGDSYGGVRLVTKSVNKYQYFKMTKRKIWLRYLILQATFLFTISIAVSQTNSKYLIIVSSKKTYRVIKGNDFNCQVKLINKGYLKITLPFLNSASNDTTLKIIHTDYKISFLKDGSTTFKVIKDGPFMRPGEVGKEISFSTYQKNISIYTPNLFISEKGRYKIKFTISYYKNKEKKLYEATSNWINIIVS